MGEQLNQIKSGLAINAALSIYAANRDKMTIDQAVKEAKEFVNTVDLDSLVNQLSASF